MKKRLGIFIMVVLLTVASVWVAAPKAQATAAAPTITQQPERYYGRVGTTATFTVKAESDSGKLTYQWQYSTDKYGKTVQSSTVTLNMQ